MPEITFPLLQSINVGVSTAFNTQLYAAASLYKNWAYDTQSDGAAEIYPRLDMIGGLREWIGARQVNSLSMTSFTIENKEFEKTIGVLRTDIEDDKYGILRPVAEELGNNAARFPDLLTSKLFSAGHTTTIYDGQNFFDTAHPNYDTNGNAGVTVANYQAGGGPSWYLIDSTRVLKPFIFQSRRSFQIIPKFSMTDENVFWNKEFEWGVDGRCNAGYGLWQLAFRSDAALTLANLESARATMASIRRADGTPMGIGQAGLTLVVPTALFPSARAYCENQFLPPGDPLVGGSGTVGNTFQGLAKALENPWLN